MKLELKTNPKQAKSAADALLPGVLLCPAEIGQDDYWIFKVELSKDQAIIAFPKFTTLGVGFLKETDWNTNLPYTCDAEMILNHIRVNKGSKFISDADCIKAIEMIREACYIYQGK